MSFIHSEGPFLFLPLVAAAGCVTPVLQSTSLGFQPLALIFTQSWWVKYSFNCMDILLSFNFANIGLVICTCDSKVQRTWCFEKLVELLGGDGDQLLVGQADVVVVGYKLADVPVLVGRGLHVHLEKYKISLFSLSAAAVFWRLQQAGLLQCVMWRRLQSSLQQVHCPLQSGCCTSTARLCSIKCNMLCRSNCFEQV